MKNFHVFRSSDADVSFPEGADSGNVIVRMIDDTYSKEIGAGMFSIHNAKNTITMPYDEVALCLKGTLKLSFDGVDHELNVGDFAWMPKGSEVTFDGDNAVAFYGIWPVDWRTRGQ